MQGTSSQPGPVATHVLQLTAVIAPDGEVDDLDVDDDFEIAIEISAGRVIEVWFEPHPHADPDYGDAGDPYWELGAGD